MPKAIPRKEDRKSPLPAPLASQDDGGATSGSNKLSPSVSESNSESNNNVRLILVRRALEEETAMLAEWRKIIEVSRRRQIILLYFFDGTNNETNRSTRRRRRAPKPEDLRRAGAYQRSRPTTRNLATRLPRSVASRERWKMSSGRTWRRWPAGSAYRRTQEEEEERGRQKRRW